MSLRCVVEREFGVMFSRNERMKWWKWRCSVMRKCAMINVRSMSDDEVRMVVT